MIPWNRGHWTYWAGTLSCQLPVHMLHCHLLCCWQWCVSPFVPPHGWPWNLILSQHQCVHACTCIVPSIVLRQYQVSFRSHFYDADDRVYTRLFQSMLCITIPICSSPCYALRLSTSSAFVRTPMCPILRNALMLSRCRRSRVTPFVPVHALHYNHLQCPQMCVHPRVPYDSLH